MSSLLNLHPTAIAPDCETFYFDRARMSPPIVCWQWAKADLNNVGKIISAVVPTKQCEEAIAWTFSREHEQIWFHNGPFDVCCVLEWYPRLRDLVRQAFLDGRIQDTMLLLRLAQIARGQIGGRLGLDAACEAEGIPPPQKAIEATHPDYPGVVFDVRTSFGLWYNAPAIPDPWHSYADYDGVATLRLAGRYVGRFMVPPKGKEHPLVTKPALDWLIRRTWGLHLESVYGLRVNPDKVTVLLDAARGTLKELRTAAAANEFIYRKAATKREIDAGAVVRGEDGVFCPVAVERRPRKSPPGFDAVWEEWLDANAEDPETLRTYKDRPVCPDAEYEQELSRWVKRRVKHLDCPGCKIQKLNDDGQPAWCINQANVKEAVVRAYDGNPPLTEAKKQKDGSFSGGGNISISKGTLEDSGDHDLEEFGAYREAAKVLNTDRKIFASSPVHPRHGIANTGRPTASNPNTLNFRRGGWLALQCESCGFSKAVELNQTNKKTVHLCPVCEAPNTETT